MAALTKKQNSALKEIRSLMAERRNNYVLGLGSLVVMALIIAIYNYLGYDLGVFDPNNFVARAMIYITALVFAGFSGIKIMHASNNSKKITRLRQENGITADLLKS